jgi:GntR family transcriptional regulator
MKYGDVAPLYARIAAVLRQRIETGVLTVGAMLPTLESYMSEFAASRVTLRQAMDMLSAEGLIARRRGFGTTVLMQPSATRDVSLPMTWQDLLVRLDSVERTRVSISLNELPTSEALNVEQVATDGARLKPRRANARNLSQKFAHMKALHHSGGATYCLVDAWMVRSIYDVSKNALQTRPSLVVLMQSHAAHVHRVTQSLTLGVADLDVATALHVALGSPVALVRRTVFNGESERIYAAKIYFPASVVRIDSLLYQR